MICIRDRAFSVKSAAEQAIYYALKINKDEKVLTNYLATLDGAELRSVSEYAKRVLSKLDFEEH